MPKLTNSLQAWQTAAFSPTLKNELEQLPPGVLPLDKATSQGGLIDDSHITATVLHTEADAHAIQARVGIFFSEIVINCGCGDDPFETNAYCEMRLRLDKTTAEAEFEVLQE